MSAPDNASLSAPKLPLAQGAVIHVALIAVLGKVAVFEVEYAAQIAVQASLLST